MSRIPLLKLPSLIQEEICCHLTVEESVLFSFLSKDLKKIMRLLRWDVMGIVYCFDTELLTIGFQTATTYDLPRRFKFLLDSKGGIYAVGYYENCKFLFEVQHRFSSENLPMQLQEHMLDMFSKCPNFQTFVAIEEMDEYKWVPFVNGVTFNNAKLADMEEFIGCQSELKRVSICHEITEDLSLDLKVFHQENIVLDQLSKRPFTEYLKYFKGKHAIFGSQTTVAHVHEFIQSFLDGTMSENLKFVYIRQNPEYQDLFPNGALLDNFETRQWDQPELPTKYPMHQDVFDYLRLSDSMSLGPHSEYLKREKDEKVISISYDSKIFIAHIWDEGLGL